MSPNMKTKLERNIQYHDDVSAFFQESVEARTEPVAEGAPDHEQTMVDLHTEVSNQLKDVLKTHDLPPAVLTAPSVFRNTSPELKPGSGRFH